MTLEEVAQDGMRVRANAGRSSFRGQKTLEESQAEAAAQVERLRQESQESTGPDVSDKRRQAAQKRSATERQTRVDEALENLKELEAQREKRKKGSGAGSRASTTDPEARNMKMANGGFRPAYNVQFGTDGKSRIIVSVDVSHHGSDGELMPPLHGAICEAYGKTPERYLVDGGFTTNDAVTQVEQAGSKVYGPMNYEKQILKKNGDPHARRKGDSDEMANFRERMRSEESKTIYKQRPLIAEFPNAVCRNHGLQQFPVRTLLKVKAVSLLHALAFNFERMLNLGALPAMN